MKDKKPKLTENGKEKYRAYILKYCEENRYISATHMSNLYYDVLNSQIGISPMDKESIKRSLSILASRIMREGREYSFLETYNSKNYRINHKKLKGFLKKMK